MLDTVCSAEDGHGSRVESLRGGPWLSASPKATPHSPPSAGSSSDGTAGRSGSLVPRRTGSFSAASNVTGVLEEVDRVTAVLHRAGALAMWDYATAAPYVRVDMNPVAPGIDDQVR